MLCHSKWDTNAHNLFYAGRNKHRVPFDGDFERWVDFWRGPRFGWHHAHQQQPHSTEEKNKIQSDHLAAILFCSLHLAVIYVCGYHSQCLRLCSEQTHSHFRSTNGKAKDQQKFVGFGPVFISPRRICNSNVLCRFVVGVLPLPIANDSLQKNE